MVTGTAWAVLLAGADTSSGGLKCPVAPVLHGLDRLAKPQAKRQTQEGVAGWPAFDPGFAEEPGLIEPYLSAILSGIRASNPCWCSPLRSARLAQIQKCHRLLARQGFLFQ